MSYGKIVFGYRSEVFDPKVAENSIQLAFVFRVRHSLLNQNKAIKQRLNLNVAQH